MTNIISDWSLVDTETVITQARYNGQHLSELSMNLFRECEHSFLTCLHAPKNYELLYHISIALQCL